MSLLFDDRLAPITSEFGFVEVSESALAEWWLARESAIQAKRGITIQRRAVAGSFEQVLLTLLPLTSVENRRTLLVPTQSRWTAFFDNGWQGSDAEGLSLAASDLKCKSVRVVAVPETMSHRGNTSRVGRYGARMFELYGSEKTDFLNYLRTISVANDGGRWRFDEAGSPLEGEDSSWYSPRNVKDRFRLEHLTSLLRTLGIDAFSEAFYAERGTLFERHGPAAAGLREYGLAEARAAFGADES
jgi:hypothetical protein